MKDVRYCIIILKPRYDVRIGISVIQVFVKTIGGLIDISWTANYPIIKSIIFITTTVRTSNPTYPIII
jgi:hypothetical protein